MNSKLETLRAKYNTLEKASVALCKSISVVVDELNSGVPIGSEMIKAQLNHSLDEFMNNTRMKIFCNLASPPSARGGFFPPVPLF